MESWRHFVPQIESELRYDDRATPWYGHRFFAYDLVRNFKPTTIVELGTEKGTSLYSFLQAVKDQDLRTEVFAVDSWRGDLHAAYSDSSGKDYYELVSKILKEFYPQQSARLMKMYFSEALKEFKDNSIDLLHIDGLHTFEAVMDDYISWKPKLTDNSVVLFHDTAVAEFGVWKALKEIAKDYKQGVTFEFMHSHGLGIVAKGDAVDAVSEVVEQLEYYRELYEGEDKRAKQSKEVEDRLHTELESLNSKIITKEEELTAAENHSKAMEAAIAGYKSKLLAYEGEVAKYHALRSRTYFIPYRLMMKIIGKEV